MFKSDRRFATFLFIFFLIIMFSNTADADDAIVFEKAFTIGEWHLHASRHTFGADDSGQGVIKISKNNPQEEIQHGFLLINGAFIFLHDFFTGDELAFEKHFTLKATNGLFVFLVGDPGASVSMQIIGIEAPVTPTQITFFTAEPATIKRGESTTLTWQTENAESCVIEPGIGTVDPIGYLSVAPTDTTDYKLTAAGAGDAATATATVTIENTAPEAQAGPDRDVFVGDTVTLDGSGSLDVDQDTLDFSWNFIG